MKKMFLAGLALVLMSPFEWVKSPSLLFRAIDQFGGTLCWMPNFAYNHCAQRIRQRDLEGLAATSGGSVIPTQVAQSCPLGNW